MLNPKLYSIVLRIPWVESTIRSRVETRINEIESHAHLTHCHDHALQLVFGDTIKAIKTMRGTLDAALNNLAIKQPYWRFLEENVFTFVVRFRLS